MPVNAAALLRAAREGSQLSQSDLARRAGIAQSVISSYESGRREPSLRTLARLIEATEHELAIAVGLLDLIGLERELAELLGVHVDVVPDNALKPRMSERVL